MADSRLELNLDKKAVQFDVTDLSRAYATILKEHYSNQRNPAEELAAILQIKNWQEVNINYVLKNWNILLFEDEKELSHNSGLKKDLKKLFELKASGSEEEYIYGLQRSAVLKKIMKHLISKIWDLRFQCQFLNFKYQIWYEPSCIATLMFFFAPHSCTFKAFPLVCF